MCHPRSPARPPAGRPRWGLLYGVTLPQLAALAVLEAAAPANLPRMALRCVLGLGAMAGLAGWIHASRPALDLECWCACASGTVTVRVIESRRPGLPDAPRAFALDDDDAPVLADAGPATKTAVMTTTSTP